MTAEEVEAQRATIAKRADERRRNGDIEGAKADERTVHALSLKLRDLRRPQETKPPTL